jgi:hypothetical protein
MNEYFVEKLTKLKELAQNADMSLEFINLLQD